MKMRPKIQPTGAPMPMDAQAGPDAGIMLSGQPDQEYPGRVGPVGQPEIDKALEDFQRYKSSKATLEARIQSNEQWYKMRHWEEMRKAVPNPSDPEPASAWLLNSISNKHADAMDNFPEPSVLPREESDAPDADVLSAILPVVLEQNGYEQVYSDMWWYKLKMGTGVQGVFWNPTKNNGLGDVEVKQIDLLNIFWEPGIKDIQKSRNLFTVELVDNDLLKGKYPFLEGKLSGSMVDVPQYLSDEVIDTTRKSAVIDWYYKLTVGTRQVLHYAKFVGRELLYASENDPAYEQTGFYAHGQYPFVFDTLFQDESSPAGFGYIDVCKEPQKYIDLLNQVILKNSLIASRPRFFVKDGGGINEAEYADMAKDFVHVAGSLSEGNILPIETKTLPDVYVAILNNKIEELKETSGNRDFSQGGTSSGVTAASAIAALQEAGSKLSRDMIKSSYRAFTLVNYMTLENIRQFYTEPRSFRIVGERGAAKFVQYTNQRIKPQPQMNAMGMDMGVRMPIFDIKVRAHRANPFSRMAQNELALSFFAKQFFNPQMSDQALACIEMMDFEGKDMVEKRIADNGTMAQMLQQLMQQMMQMGTIIDATQQGSNLVAAMSQQFGQMGAQPPAPMAGNAPAQTNQVGNITQLPKGNPATKAQERAQNVSAPK